MNSRQQQPQRWSQSAVRRSRAELQDSFVGIPREDADAFEAIAEEEERVAAEREALGLPARFCMRDDERPKKRPQHTRFADSDDEAASAEQEESEPTSSTASMARGLKLWRRPGAVTARIAQLMADGDASAAPSERLDAALQALGREASSSNSRWGAEEQTYEQVVELCREKPKGIKLKYWVQRHRYFSRFDEGAALDGEGWFSVTPEAIAAHIASRCICPSRSLILDPFVGCGGNAVQFALRLKAEKRSGVVFAVDLNAERLEMCRKNAQVYGVESYIEFVLADGMALMSDLRKMRCKPDVVFLSPPWGGPDYTAGGPFDLNTDIPAPLNGIGIFEAAKGVTDNVAYFLPKNVQVKQVAALASELPCELEDQILNQKRKTCCAYWGHLVRDSQRTQRHGKGGDYEGTGRHNASSQANKWRRGPNGRK